MEKKGTGIWFAVLSVMLAALFCADILLGSEGISLGAIWDALTGADRGAEGEITRSIIMKFRLPKAVVAVAAGAALSASGLQMQTFFRNPLAGPYVLGISSGASLGVALFLLGAPILGLSGHAGEVIRSLGMAGAAWVGSAVILLMVMAVSARIKDIMAILILGIMFGSAASAFVQILQYASPEGALKSFVIWTMGSLGGVSESQLWVMLPVIGAGLLISVLLIKPLNIMMLGENYARTTGLSLPAVRTAIFVGTSLLAGSVTAFCGPIGFLGVAVPHMARMLFSQADHRIVMPASMLMGAALMLLSDIIAQMPWSDYTLPVNTVTALLGIPVIVIVIVRNRKIM